MQAAALEIEIILGLLLLSKVAIRLTWVLAIVFFAGASALSLSQSLQGQASCECFGRLSVWPWFTFGLDVLAVCGLLIFRPRSDTVERSPTTFRALLRSSLGAGVTLVLGCLAFLLLVPDPARLLAQLRGESIIVQPGETNVGEGRPGEQRTFGLELVNNGEQPIRIIGGTANCSCMAIADLPVEIGPGRATKIRVTLYFKGMPGRFRREFVLYTDAEKQPVARAYLAGRISPE